MDRNWTFSISEGFTAGEQHWTLCVCPDAMSIHTVVYHSRSELRGAVKTLLTLGMKQIPFSQLAPAEWDDCIPTAEPAPAESIRDAIARKHAERNGH